jgi:serine/threonine protein kinase
MGVKMQGFDGIKFGPYLLITELGRGGYARVFLALVRETNKLIALKVLRADVVESDEDSLRRLKDEKFLGSLLDHANIVKAMDVKRVGRDWCLEMEFVDGFTLDELLYLPSEVRDGRIEKRRRFREPIPTSVVVDVALQVCEGLKHAHRVSCGSEGIGLVHRDIKPANLMITGDGAVKIADFGTAKFAQALRTANVTRMGMARGSPAYLSPEQASAQQVDARSDLFSFGTVLVEMLAYRQVFIGNTREVMEMIVFRDPVARSRWMLIEAGRSEFVSLVESLHAKLGQRLQRVDEVIDSLRLVQNVSSGPRLGEWLRANEQRLPPSKPLNEWGKDGPPQEVLSLNDLTRTVFTGSFRAVSRCDVPVAGKFGEEVEHVFTEPETNGDGDRLTVRDVSKWLSSRNVQPLSSSLPQAPLVRQAARPQGTKPVGGAEVVLGSANFGAETVDAVRLREENLEDERGAGFWNRGVMVCVVLASLACVLAIVTRPCGPPSREEFGSRGDEVVPTSAPVEVVSVTKPITEPTPGPTHRATPTPRAEKKPSSEAVAHQPLEDASPLEQVPVAEETSKQEPTLPMAKITLGTSPEAKVYVNEKFIGTTPLSEFEVAPMEEHTVRLECVGCSTPETIELTFNLQPGEHATRTRKFASAPPSP